MTEKSCCFTGHREKKLNISKEEVKMLLEKAIDDLISQGYCCFISGMADGVDLWAAEIIMKKREKYNILLKCAVPYPSFAPSGDSEQKEIFREILNHADSVEYVSDHYFRGCFQKRNVFMVDNSAVVVAVFNGDSGGTKNTIEYAKRKNKKIVNVLEEKN